MEESLKREKKRKRIGAPKGLVGKERRKRKRELQNVEGSKYSKRKIYKSKIN